MSWALRNLVEYIPTAAAGVTVTLDVGAPLEMLTTSQRTMSDAAELVASSLSSLGVPQEMLYGILLGNQDPAELLMTSRGTVPVGAEELTAVSRSTSVWAEALASLALGLLSTGEMLSTPAGGLPAPVELQGAVSVTSIVGASIEIQTQFNVSLSPTAEFLLSLGLAESAGAELLTAAMGQAASLAELQTRPGRDTTVNVELTAVFAGTTFGTAFEVTRDASFAVDGSIEWLGNAVVNVLSPMELSGTSAVVITPNQDRLIVGPARVRDIVGPIKVRFILGRNT